MYADMYISTHLPIYECIHAYSEGTGGSDGSGRGRRQEFGQAGSQ